MTEHDKRSTSKYISLVLRHNPGAAGITLDKNGWADVSELLDGMNQTRRSSVTLEDLKDIVATNDKKRFIFNEDTTRIRANQGHSISVDVELNKCKPPDSLYHGTLKTSILSIMAEGLKPKKRLHVHLSNDTETAVHVGNRRGEPAVLIVDSGRMYADGYTFYLSENGVWLTKFVPANYLQKSDDL